jgi:P pilus assembly chaperone PapD
MIRPATAALVAMLAIAVAPSAARAGLEVSPLIVDVPPGGPPTADVEVMNDGDETLYVVVEPTRIDHPGDASERRTRDPDPQALGLLTTPQRLVLAPGERKFLRLALLSPPGETDRVFRVTVKPVVGEVSGQATGLKILIGYELLVIQRPARPAAPISASRDGATLILRNDGNTNAELFQGQACDAARHCTPLASHRLYAGTTWSVPLAGGSTAEYQVKVGAKVTTARF